ncbi:hypothetical protein KUF71_008053 [Frankliniella fusca]|uniref:RNA-directed DNA polymerase n=1 Tax=Frankliniella fusca TaxID=407009 RepID=A0AAE1HCM6_9NEOP|nr:hypothetical protein KUF71_008053 [Frankliniella fusca]
MSNIQRPGPVNLRSGNIQASWTRFHQKFSIYLLATQQENAAATVKFALLLGEAGDDALEIYNSFKDKLITYKKDQTGQDVVDVDKSQDYDSVVKEFENYAAAKKCVLACRETFRQRSQKPKESVVTWLAALRNLSRDCEFGPIEESMIQNRLILGAYDKQLRDSLMSKSNLPLSDVVDIHKLAETRAKYPHPEGVESMAVDSVQTYNRQGGKPARGRGQGKRPNNGRPNPKPQKPSTSHGKRQAFTYKCRKCLEVHEAGNCPAWGKKCHKCGMLNHYAATHNSKRKPTPETKKVNTLVSLTDKEEQSLLEGKFSSSETDLMDIGEVRYVDSLGSCSSDRPKEYLEEIRVNGTHWIVFKLDPGSQVNLITLKDFKILNSQNDLEMIPTKAVLEAWDESTRQPDGLVRLKVETKYGRSMDYKFYVSLKGRRAILGLRACEDLDLIRRVIHPVTVIDSVTVNSIVLPESKDLFISQYKELFTGLGQFKQKVTIVVDPQVQPRMCPPRRYNFSIINRLKDKLDNLVQRGVVAKITTESPKFVSNLVIREKSDGDLRICLDPEFQPRVEYLPGKLLHLADLLSRNCLNDPVEDDPEMVEYVHEVVENIPMSSDMKERFLTETDKDAGLSAAKRFYQNGWPSTRDKVPLEARQYWGIRNDLFVEDDLVILNDRIVVPEVLRPKVLKRLHAAHLGMDKTKSRARQSVYWPGLSNDIETLIRECRICERHSAQNFKEPLIPHEIPQLRFQKVSVDIMELDSKCYLVLVDNLSKWLEIKPLTRKSSSAVIGVLRVIFATHGVPEIIFGDNNPLNSAECHEFAASIGSEVRTSSPEYPRSNGLAEKGVHIAKQLIKKCTDEGTHYLDALREYNNTPLSGMDVSPSQILMSRICRTSVPMLQKQLEPKVVNIHPTLEKLRNKVTSKHDAHARRKPVTFKVGNSVALRRGNKWTKGIIVAKHKADRSYLVKLLDGKILRRNTYHLRHSFTKPDGKDSGVNVDDILDSLRAGQNRETANPNPNTACVLAGPQNPNRTEAEEIIPSSSRHGLTAGEPGKTRSGRRVIPIQRFGNNVYF